MSCVFVMSSHAQVRMFFRRWQIFLLDSDHLTCTSASCSCQWKNQNPIWATLYSGFARFLHELWFLLLSLFDYSDKLNAGTMEIWFCEHFLMQTPSMFYLDFPEEKSFCFKPKWLRRYKYQNACPRKQKSLWLLIRVYWNPTSLLISW